MNTTDKGLPELPEVAHMYCPGCEDDVPMYSADQMRAMYEKGKQDALSAASGKAVAWMRRDATYREGDGRTDGERIVSERKAYPDDLPLYLHPATVTDEDVEQALEQYLTCMHNRAKIKDAMRAAISAFANKENRND